MMLMASVGRLSVNSGASVGCSATQRPAYSATTRRRRPIAVAFNWLWDYLTFQRSVRLITND